MAVARNNVADNRIKKKLGIVNHITKDEVNDIISRRYGREIHVKDFGAKGDGIKNDSTAIKKAITALRRSSTGSTLVFEKDKTYLIFIAGDCLCFSNWNNSRLVFHFQKFG